MATIPKTGFKGLLENWQSDLIAAISVALVAMPLALGIAFASGVPPITGVFSAIIGGLVTTFFRGAHISINGPTAGLIAVILTSITALDDGTANVLNYVFAAIVVSGSIQVLLGLLKMGKYADLFHSTVIHGILAAIGIIIFAKQIHFTMGTTSSSSDVIGTIVDAVRQIPNVNPFVAIISLVGLLLLIFHSKLSFKFFHFLPAPMWVLVLSIPFVYIFNFQESHSMNFFGKTFDLGPALLVNIPENILDAIAYPNFSKINTWPFWASVMSITMIASIESLASAKAVDKLDPYKRKTDLNKDLVGVGISTMVSGAIGGLPIINVIVRSTVNVHNQAKTKWSNFYHGLLLLAFIFVLAPVIQKVPLCALAIILVYTGYKLASPTVFRHIYDQGIEQLIFFVGTLVITLYTNLLIGTFGGLLLALVSHMLLARVPVRSFFRMLFHPGSELINKGENVYQINLKGIANFLSTIKINQLINAVPDGATTVVDLSEARLVDFSILENLYEFRRRQRETGGQVRITGLEQHTASAKHKMALKLLTDPMHRPSPRQKKLNNLAADHDWKFNGGRTNNVDYLQGFDFFESRPIEYKINSVFGGTKDRDWEIFDVRFDEGAFEAFEEYQTTLGLIKFTFKIPKFTIEKKTYTDKIFHYLEHKDIDYEVYHDFPHEYLVRTDDLEEIHRFLTDEMKSMIDKSPVIHHIESNGEALLLFIDNLRLAPIKDYGEIVSFAERFKKLVVNSNTRG